MSSVEGQGGASQLGRSWAQWRGRDSVGGKGSKEEEFMEEGWVSEQEEVVCELWGKVGGGCLPEEGRWG